jgi:iron complex outermembrane receptor protein
MARKYIFSSILFILCGLITTSAQESRKTITGEIVTHTGIKADGANVFLHRSKDSVLVKTGITDANGVYVLGNISTGNYYLLVRFTGYAEMNIKPVVIDQSKEEFKLAVITLTTPVANQLAEVVVTGRKSFVERRSDRVVVNPDALISNAGTTALDVLEKAPAVQVDPEGAISLRGRPGVVVFIDDKPTYMSQQDLTAYLRSLPSGDIESIEIMTNPPARYDAAGNSGVINIRLKKTKVSGLNGSINLGYGQGTYARSNNSMTLNYRINKLNFFTNLSHSINNTYQDLTLKRQYFSTAGSLQSSFTQRSFIKRMPRGFNYKAGVDYYANKKLTMGIVVTGVSNRNKEDIHNDAVVRNSNGDIANTVAAHAPRNRSFDNIGTNLNLAYKLDGKSKLLTFNADYLKYRSDQDNSLLNIVYNPNQTIASRTNLVSDLPASIEITTAQLDYSQPFLKGNLEAGAKTSIIRTNNNALFYDEQPNGSFVVNNEFSNNFRYHENINAAYLTYSLEQKRFGFKLGLRFENTEIKGFQYGTPSRPDSSFTRTFNNLFPTMYLSYKLDTADNHVLNINFGRRINRPNYQDMNPFTYPLDRYTLYGGNPFLRPTFSYNTELSYTYKRNYTLSLQYSYVNDLIMETIEQRNNIFYSRPGNFGKQVSFSASLSGMIPVTKWWKLQLYTELTKNKFTATLYQQNLHNEGTYVFVGPVNIFQISPLWTAELGGNYQSSVYVGQFVTIPVGSVRAAVAKKILKQKGTVRLSVNDFLYTNQPGGNIKGIQNSTASWKSYLDTRVFTLSFSYRFNKGKSLSQRNTGSSDAERGRVGG